LRIADEVEAVAGELGALPPQVAPAWLLARGDDIVPIPGTKQVSRVEENIAARGHTLHHNPAAGPPRSRSRTAELWVELAV
jgi:aryl-alcohol dehydrogenase-like predicted oxidoreductase